MENFGNNYYRKAKAKKNVKKTITYVFLVLISVIWLVPFVYLILQSFAASYDNGTHFAPTSWTFDNYVRLFTDTNYPFWQWFLNTLIIALVTAVIQTILVLATSYALSRLRFRGRQAIMKMILLLGMFPGFLSMIVIYEVLRIVGLQSSIYSLILIYCGSSAMNYYIAKGFFDTIPKSLDEAVYVDGGNKNTVFWRIILPLSKPIIVYTVLISFMSPWGDFILASYLAQGNKAMMNVAVGLKMMLSYEVKSTYFNTFCAGAVLTSIPIMALFFALQRYYVEGIAGGAVKG